MLENPRIERLGPAYSPPFGTMLLSSSVILDYRSSFFFQVYVLPKLLTEEAAFAFAIEKGIDLVSVITTTVAGPFLTSTVPSSIRVLLSPVTGDY